MTDRITPAQREERARAAEIEIMRYAGDHFLWHYHLHGVKLDQMQVLKCIEMDNHPYTIDVSCRRTGKTAVKEMYHLNFLATNWDQELGIVAPRLDQSKVNITYITDAIARSPALSAFVKYKNGRKQLSETSLQFFNNSKATAYGIMSQVDGGDLTCASIEEVDDMPWERLNSNFLLMLGGARRLGADENAKNDPAIRITGVFKGGETVEQLLDEGKYKLLPVVDMYMGVAMGIVQKEFFEGMRHALTPADFCRQLLCERVRDGGFILRKNIRSCISNGIMANIELQEPIPGHRHDGIGQVTFGYDASGHGEQSTSSRHALFVSEMLGNHIVPLFVKTWPPATDESVVAHDIVSFWRYFKPKRALGDALGVAMIAMVNDLLFNEGLIDVDRRTVGNGDSSQSTWPHWVFSPIRFEGTTKHQMATALALSINNKRWALPYLPELEEGDTRIDRRDLAGKKPDAIPLNHRRSPHTEDLINDYSLFLKQLENIKSVQVKSGAYNSYQMIDKKVGDDLFDAAMANVWAHVTAGQAVAPPAVVLSGQSRQHVLTGTSRMAQLQNLRS